MIPLFIVVVVAPAVVKVDGVGDGSSGEELLWPVMVWNKEMERNGGG